MLLGKLQSALKGTKVIAHNDKGTASQKLCGFFLFITK